MQHHVSHTSPRFAALVIAMTIVAAAMPFRVHNDADYCERFWKDYGNSVRGANGVMVPRMFSELPVCAAAFKARKALADDAR